LIITHPTDPIQRELIALAVNLAANARNAEIMCALIGFYNSRALLTWYPSSRCQTGLSELMARAFRSKDVLLMKLIRTLAQHDYPSKNTFSVCQQHSTCLLEN